MPEYRRPQKKRPPEEGKRSKEPLRKIEAPAWREFRILMASKLYGSGQMSSERASRMGGVGHVEFLLNLNFYKIFPLQAELNDLEKSNE